MRIFEGFDGLPSFQRPVVTVGSFDGVHRGHMALLERVVAQAKESGGESVVITFSPHPREVLGGGVRLLTTLPEKARLLEQAGIDNLIIVPFTAEFSRLSGEEFINILTKYTGMRTLVMGYNHHFGSDRMDADRVCQKSARSEHGGHNFDVEVVPNCDDISSTVIRRLIDEGRLTEAAEHLGHDFR